LHFTNAIPAVAELPLSVDHLGHYAGTVNKGHHDHAHLVDIQFRRMIEPLLTGNGQAPAGSGQFDHLVAGIADAAHVGIGLQRIERPPLEKRSARWALRAITL
jgi:hypothetical protein